MTPDEINAFVAEVASIAEALRAFGFLPRAARRRLAAALIVRATERIFLNPGESP